MIKRLSPLLTLTLALLASGWDKGQPTSNDTSSDELVGRVTAPDGTPIAGAMVIACDQKTGIPVDRETSRPFTESERGPLNAEPAVAVSGADGKFALPALKPGTYRLQAQRWPERSAAEPPAKPTDINGREVELCGVAENVVVPVPDGQVVALVADGGGGTLHIDQHVPNNETFLLISREPLAGDAILGYWVWDARFLGGLLAYNRMPDGVTTARGLPAGKLYVSMFAADNVPGFASAEVEIKPDQTTRLSTPFVAGWSDGRHDPPPRLQPLFDDFQAGKFTLADVLGGERADRFNMYTLFQTTSAAVGPLDRVVELPGGGTATVADLLAVKLYGDLQRGVAQRQARTQQTAVGQASYEEALQGLWQTLKAQYPCFQLKKIDWDAVGKELLPRAKQVKSADEFGLLCMEMVARLEDSHAYLLDGTHKVPRPPLPMWQPGFACLRADDGAAVVYHVAPDSTAQAAGMKIGMIVERLDDQPVADAIQKTMNDVKKYYGYSSERYLQYHAYRWFARRSTRGESVRLQGHDAAGKPFDLTMIADSEPGYTPRLPVPAAGVADSGNVSWKMLDGQVGYIYVRRIRQDLIETLDKAVGELKDAHALIIDVRGNSGGGFDSRRAHLNFALDRDEEEPQRPRFRGPMAVLIDARCISAGEGWASWFAANKRAKFFGQATAGASARKTVYELPGGLFKVRFPVKAYRGYLDRPIERLGLAPDVPLLPKAADIADGRDTVLEAARARLLKD